MHVADIFATFYIRGTIVLTKIANIKRSPIKDSLQYMFDNELWFYVS